MRAVTPWHEVVQLRDDLRTGELSLSLFAADLYDVAMGTARPVYRDPPHFFALTYPTFNLRELAKDVVLRLAGKNDKAIRQLELTYGGGKTHTLITLYHLTHNPALLSWRRYRSLRSISGRCRREREWPCWPLISWTRRRGWRCRRPMERGAG